MTRIEDKNLDCGRDPLNGVSDLCELAGRIL
jgi:hypothetical protein